MLAVVVPSTSHLAAPPADADSGRACLAAILELHGKTEAAARARIEMEGESALAILDHARRLGLPGVAVRLERRDVGALPPGSILFWDQRFVVLKDTGEHTVTIVEPPSEAHEVSLANAEHAFSGVALVFDAEVVAEVESSTSPLLAMTRAQRDAFDRDGFFVVEDFLTAAELEDLVRAVDVVAERARTAHGKSASTPVTIRNALSHHEEVLRWIDHPKLLPFIVDAIGWNIQVRTTHIDHRPPYPPDWEHTHLVEGRNLGTVGAYRSLALHADFAQSFLFGATSLDGRLPFMEIKVGFFLSDTTLPGSGALALVPGSHLRPISELQGGLRDDEIVEFRVRAGTMLLFRTSVWHAVTPNVSDLVRKVLYIGYQHRFLRPTDYVHQDAALVERSSPIRRQLLGEMGTLGSPVGSDVEFHPSSQFWLTHNDDDVPLKAWAEAQRALRQKAG